MKSWGTCPNVTSSFTGKRFKWLVQSLTYPHLHHPLLFTSFLSCFPLDLFGWFFQLSWSTKGRQLRKMTTKPNQMNPSPTHSYPKQSTFIRHCNHFGKCRSLVCVQVMYNSTQILSVSWLLDRLGYAERCQHYASKLLESECGRHHRWAYILLRICYFSMASVPLNIDCACFIEDWLQCFIVVSILSLCSEGVKLQN